MKHFAWDYEESLTNYYHIYSCSEGGEWYSDGSIFTLDANKTDDNDNIVNDIVVLLDRFVDLNYKY